MSTATITMYATLFVALLVCAVGRDIANWVADRLTEWLDAPQKPTGRKDGALYAGDPVPDAYEKWEESQW